MNSSNETFENKGVKCSGVSPKYANAHPRATIKLRMPHSRDRQREQMPRGCPGGMGTAGIDWYIIVEYY